MKKSVFIVLIMLLSSYVAIAQKVASGIVKDKTGELLIGVSVIEKGNTANGTITDINGKFKLQLKADNSIIQFSYIGYKTKELAVELTQIVVLESASVSMDEVVVVGYGKQRKETVIGAITTVKGELLQQASSSNLTNSLAGRVSGVTTMMGSGRPGLNESQIYIRGISTLSSGNTNPLILVDGVERDMGNVDADDIENFTVLKDAAATAVYGIRGANGVILVTTKRGKEGKAKVSASIIHSQSELIRLFTKLNSFRYASLRNEALVNDGMPIEYTSDDLQKYNDHTSPYTHPDNNYADDFLRKFSPKTQMNINVSGGTDRIKYFVSANYLNEEGILKNYSKAADLERFDTYRSLSDDLKRTFRDVTYNPNPSFEKFSLRTNFDITISKSTTLAVDLTSRIEKIRNIGIANSTAQDFFSRFFRAPPNLFPYITPNGKFGAQGGDNQSPLVYLTSAGYQLTNQNTIEGTIRLNQKLDFLTQGLSIDGEISFDNLVNSGWKLNHNPEIGRYSKNGIYTVINTETDWSTSSTAKASTRQIVSQMALRYNKTFNASHNIGGLILTKQRQYYAGALLPEFDLDYVARLTYNYKSKYMTEMNMAYNGSSNFNKDKRFGFFPSLSMGWAVSEENFWKNNLKNVDFLKLRASVGEVGNDKLGAMSYFYQNSYGNGYNYSFGDGNTVSGTTGYWETQLGNPFVTWERALKGNVGIDARFLNKFKVTVDYFHEYRYDILAKRNTFSQTLGFNYALPAENIGVVRNQGVEFDFDYNDTFGKVKFWINTNLTYAKNKIEAMDEIIYPDELSYKRKTGLPVGTQFGYLADGLYQSWDEINDPNTPKNLLGSPQPGDLKFVDRNGDGFINDYDIGVIGKSKVPELTGGFTVGAAYKQFSFNMMWQGAAFSSYNLSYVMKEFSSGLDALKQMHESRWAYYTDPLTGELVDTRATATFHRLSTNNTHFNHELSTANVRSSDYLRLKSAEISYALPTSLLKKLSVSKLMVFARGNNLLLFDYLKEFGVDPESNDNSTGYPQTRIYSFGLSINF